MGLIYCVVDVLEEAGTKPSSLFHDLFSPLLSMNIDTDKASGLCTPFVPLPTPPSFPLEVLGAAPRICWSLGRGGHWGLHSPSISVWPRRWVPALQNSQRKCWRGGEKTFPYGNKILPIIAFLISTVTWPSYIFSSDIRPPSPPNWDRTTIIISQILTDMFLIHTIFKSKKKSIKTQKKIQTKCH